MSADQERSPKKYWFRTSSAAAQIDIHPQHLRRLRAEGLFQEGKHWINVRRVNHVRPSYRWHVANCIAAMAEIQKLEGKLLPKK
jgi:hypothetical protein